MLWYRQRHVTLRERGLHYGWVNASKIYIYVSFFSPVPGPPSGRGPGQQQPLLPIEIFTVPAASGNPSTYLKIHFTPDTLGENWFYPKAIASLNTTWMQYYGDVLCSELLCVLWCLLFIFIYIKTHLYLSVIYLLHFIWCCAERIASNFVVHVQWQRFYSLPSRGSQVQGGIGRDCHGQTPLSLITHTPFPPKWTGS